MRYGKRAVPALWACALSAAAWGADSGLKAAVKQLREKYQDAIVTVKLVVSTRMVYSGRETHKSENKNEVCGTVLDASGLTVISNFASDPTAQMGEYSFSSDGEKMEFKYETDVTEVKIVLADGTELAAQLVLKDKDLDLAFVKPKEKPAQPLFCLPLAKAPAPEIMDEVFVLSRLGREVGRVSAVGAGHISALVRKPRTFYVADLGNAYASMGCPVFDARGQTLGLSVMRMNPIKSGDRWSYRSVQPVILPTEDLLDVAKQALAAKPEEKKEGAPPAEGK